MVLTFTEADFWMRSGEEVRRDAMPYGDFISLSSKDIDGYEKTEYHPSFDDLNATDWRRASWSQI